MNRMGMSINGQKWENGQKQEKSTFLPMPIHAHSVHGQKWAKTEKMPIFAHAHSYPFCPLPPKNDELDRMGMGINGQNGAAPSYDRGDFNIPPSKPYVH